MSLNIRLIVQSLRAILTGAIQTGGGNFKEDKNDV